MTLIGLMSDSHGRVATTERATRMLVQRGATHLIHLGDVGGEAVLEAMLLGLDNDGRLHPPVHVVFGNTDWDARDLADYARRLGIDVQHPAGRMTIDGRTIAFTHGDAPNLMQQATRDEVDYLCHGHTHRQRDEQIGPTRVINPGALFRATRHTVALLDPGSGHLEFLVVPDA